MEKNKKDEYYQAESGNVVISFWLCNYVYTLHDSETFKLKILKTENELKYA